MSLPKTQKLISLLMLCGNKRSYIIKQTCRAQKAQKVKFFSGNFLLKLRISTSNNYWCLKKFLTETLHFSGCWLFLKKWNNEIVVINIITPSYNFKSPIKVYPPHKSKKKFCPHKIFANFQIKSPHFVSTFLKW